MADYKISDLAELKEVLIKKAPVSIMDEDVTGVKGSNDAPDTLFYSEFSEEDAEAYFEIFTRFKDSYEINTRVAIESLEYNLNQQIKAMPRNVSSIEIILFASRCIKDLIKSDTKVYKVIKNIIAKQLKSSSNKIAWYILSGWEWKQQLSIFVEAIGEDNDDYLIKMAMRYYGDIAESCAEDDDKSVLNSYVNMLFASQNGEYLEYIADVVSHNVFMNDIALVDTFIDKCKKTAYLKTEPLFSNLLHEINSRNITPSFRTKLGYVQSRQADIMQISKPLATTSELTALEFGRTSAQDLYKCERTKGEDSKIVVSLVMDNIDNIYPEEQRGRAYVVIATKAKFYRDEVERQQVIDFLINEKEEYPLYELAIDTALMEMNELGFKEVFDTLISSKYKAFWGKNIASYFRYNKRLFANDFIPYLEKVLNKEDIHEEDYGRAIYVLAEIVKSYNGKADKLNDDIEIALPDKLLNLICKETFFKDRLIYESILEILEIIMRISPSKKKIILNYLDKVKAAVSGRANLLSVEIRVDSMIRKGDTLSEPD